MMAGGAGRVARGAAMLVPGGRARLWYERRMAYACQPGFESVRELSHAASQSRFRVNLRASFQADLWHACLVCLVLWPLPLPAGKVKGVVTLLLLMSYPRP